MDVAANFLFLIFQSDQCAHHASSAWEDFFSDESVRLAGFYDGTRKKQSGPPWKKTLLRKEVLGSTTCHMPISYAH